MAQALYTVVTAEQRSNAEPAAIGEAETQAALLLSAHEAADTLSSMVVRSPALLGLSRDLRLESDEPSRLLRILGRCEDKLLVGVLGRVVPHFGSKRLFALLESEKVGLPAARRMRLRILILQQAADTGVLQDARASVAVRNEIVVALIAECLALLSSRVLPSGEMATNPPRLPVNLAHRHHWLDSLPPFAPSHSPGPSASASNLALLRQVQALVCRHLDQNNSQLFLDAIQSANGGKDYPGRTSLCMLCWPLSGQLKVALAWALVGTPAIAAAYVTSLVQLHCVEAVPTWLALLRMALPLNLALQSATETSVSKLADSSTLDGEIRSVLRSGSVVRLPPAEEFLAAFELMLRGAAETLGEAQAERRRRNSCWCLFFFSLCLAMFLSCLCRCRGICQLSTAKGRFGVLLTIY